jgi:hypothetical protein
MTADVGWVDQMRCAGQMEFYTAVKEKNWPYVSQRGGRRGGELQNQERQDGLSFVLCCMCVYHICGVVGMCVWCSCVVMCECYAMGVVCLPNPAQNSQGCCSYWDLQNATSPFNSSWYILLDPSLSSLLQSHTLVPWSQTTQDFEDTSCQFTNSINQPSKKAEVAWKVSDKWLSWGAHNSQLMTTTVIWREGAVSPGLTWPPPEGN